MKAKEIKVHMDLDGGTRLVGRLWIHGRDRRESASFDYAREWKRFPGCFPLEPALFVGEGAYHTHKALFGAIGDSAPDRWGRNLMQRLEARAARNEGRSPRHLAESDFLLRVSDFARLGALRFSISGTDFLATEEEAVIPPRVALPKLLAASERLIVQGDDFDDLQDLAAPGSSLGGARPKAVVVDNDRLLIAKFPSPNDGWDVVSWEYLALTMARDCGIPTPEFQRIRVMGKPVLLLDRFDRAGGRRIHFLSAMSMLNALDGELRSYLEVADVLSAYGASAGEDLKDLWSRMVLNILISNVDDHLRNHGFLFAGQAGWRLSPIYDLEPTPAFVKARELSTCISLDDATASLELAMEVASHFGLDLKAAKARAGAIAHVVKSWASRAGGMGIPKAEVDFMASAFDHAELGAALKY